jgi:hypothetical protein
MDSIAYQITGRFDSFAFIIDSKKTACAQLQIGVQPFGPSPAIWRRE